MTTEKFRWQSVVASYARPELGRSLWQAINTLVPYFTLFYLAMRSLEISFWLTLPLSFLTAGFMVRTFIIFHDCGHGSFFKSKKANTWMGRFTGLLVFTPYYRWTHDHAIHHATASDLDRRGVGDVYTMTVEEYMAAPWWKQAGYRIMRNPIAMFFIGSIIVFIFAQRVPPKKDRREQASVWWTNLSLAVMVTAMCLLFGWKAYIIVQVLVLFFGTSVGVWLFYVQHNFDPTYWERHEEWEYFNAGIEGSSFYKLPKLLQWFTGNIGFHHIHHLSPKIPNYKLEQCHKENPVFQVKPMTIRGSLKSLYFRLWDEKERMLVGWNALKKYRTRPVKA
jgi:acyl-lipid omega-6 desaturase (Delta-12 desaturase)